MRLPVLVLIVHIVAVAVWVGGQITLAFLVPALRDAAGDETGGRALIGAAGRRFQVVAWAAFTVLLFTGMWLILEPVNPGVPMARLLTQKLVFVALSAIAAVVHAVGTGPRVRRVAQDRPERARRIAVASGIISAGGLVCALVALGYGVVLVVGR